MKINDQPDSDSSLPNRCSASPGARSETGIGLFSLHVVGSAIYGLLGRSPETREELNEILAKRSPSDVCLLKQVISTLPQNHSIREIIKILAARKSRDYYERFEEDAAVPNIDGAKQSRRAVILPLPPHLTYIVEDTSPELIFKLKEHPIPHHLNHLNARHIPSKIREIREIFQSVTSLSFEGYYITNGYLHTREEIVDLLDALTEVSFKPRLVIHTMPHRPPHEAFTQVGKEWEVVEI